LIAVVYVLGTTAVLWRLPNKDVNVVSGFLQAIKAGADNISPTLGWLAPLCAALYAIGNLVLQCPGYSDGYVGPVTRCITVHRQPVRKRNPSRRRK